MDNIVMIQAGEAIDMSLGVTFGLSTLTAAGFGQCVSDVAGFTCGGIVDAAVSKMNLPHHNLSQAQLDLQVTRTCHTLGGCVGVVTGCLLGMTSLLFMDTDRADRAKKAKELNSIFESILEEGHLLINAGTMYQLRSSVLLHGCLPQCLTCVFFSCPYTAQNEPRCGCSRKTRVSNKKPFGVGLHRVSMV